jgi:hypothetical protein
MEDPKVKIILTSDIQMTNKLSNNNYKSEELLFHNEMDHKVQNKKICNTKILSWYIGGIG